MKKDLLKLSELTKDEFLLLLDRARNLKKRHKSGICECSMRGKTVGLLFDKASTRTRISFEAGASQLGASTIFMNAADTQIGRSEPVSDTARVLSRYIDCLVIRTFSQELIEEYASYCDIPVINALSDDYHPCQILSDILTVVEHKGGIEGKKIAWIGDGNNVAQSWLNAAAVLGFDLSLACPEGYQPDPVILQNAIEKGTGNITVVSDAREAVKDADIIYTDVWASMGQESEQNDRVGVFKNYQVDSKLMAAGKPDVSFMHCLPAHRGEEVTEEVMEGPSSIIWDQAENKLHMHKAILDVLINGI